MATWEEFSRAAPELAEFGRKRFERFHVVMLATVGSDGAPRLAPVTPIIAGGKLFAFVNPKTPKFRDLRREPRYVIHALMDLGIDDEFQISGHSRLIEDEPTIAMAVTQAGYPVLEQDPDAKLFEFSVERGFSTIWHHQGQPDTRPIRKSWRETQR
jgi:general stress protein 26